MAQVINDLSDTWNDSGNLFTAVRVNITDTASDSGSKLLDLLVGGSSKLTIKKNGDLLATGNVTAYYSDERLKDFLGPIENVLEKLQDINGYYFRENKLAKTLGYNNDRIQIGVSAQEIEEVFPEIVTESAIGGGFKTVWYDKLTPILLQAVKEQQVIINSLIERIEELEK